ncbi:uncharacterized protein LOC131858628 [Cryptomeria japonica]|uniref:uncharacterized protein LOC131858628 n=1 Tax=Cryptomeria japonica TaxID=3369 RepID=UPI0027DA329C|nr:uncharacterized protein LOC131858628 [Cryptomeria japonica]
MTVNDIVENDVRFASMLVGYKVYQSNKKNLVFGTAIFTAYQMLKENKREAVQKEREKNILKEEDAVKKQAKPIPPKQPKSKPIKSALAPNVQKLVPPPPKSKPTISIGGVEKRKKEKPTRQYTAPEEEKKLDEEVREEINKILGLAKENFRSKHRVNKIMIIRVYEVVKDTEGILRKILKENGYQVIPEKNDTQLEGHSSKDTSNPTIHVQTEVPQDQLTVQIDQVE